MIKTVKELLEPLLKLPLDKEICVIVQDSKGAFDIIGVDEWEEGATIVVREHVYPAKKAGHPLFRKAIPDDQRCPRCEKCGAPKPSCDCD
jgi:hypothetical protein